ncbi:MAG: hypothetical protein ACJAVR_002652 [Paracoccaceae bacterium]|jgi:hypothetical protein
MGCHNHKTTRREVCGACRIRALADAWRRTVRVIAPDEHRREACSDPRAPARHQGGAQSGNQPLSVFRLMRWCQQAQSNSGPATSDGRYVCVPHQVLCELRAFGERLGWRATPVEPFSRRLPHVAIRHSGLGGRQQVPSHPII